MPCPEKSHKTLQGLGGASVRGTVQTLGKIPLNAADEHPRPLGMEGGCKERE